MQPRPGLAATPFVGDARTFALAWLLPFGWESLLAADRPTPDEGCPADRMRPLGVDQGLLFPSPWASPWCTELLNLALAAQQTEA